MIEDELYPGCRVSRDDLKRSLCIAALLFGALCGLALSGRTAQAATEFGILQFKVEHNLEAPGCVAAGSCFIGFEELADPAAWLAEIRRVSDLATLHWDRAVPWLVFDVDPPVGSDRVAFYDARLDAPTVAWLDAFVLHFATMGRGYLAVSLLSGERDRLSPLHLGLSETVPFTNACPNFSPGAQVTVDPGTGPQVFDLGRSYRNFVLYLAMKLSPDYLALMVEVNLIEAMCPARADGLYALYRSLYDQVRAELGPGLPLFATLSYPLLLAYDRQACYPTAQFQACDTPPGPSAPDAGSAACFPTDRGAIDALDQGGRLDVLALSFYPDSLEMNPVASEIAETRAYHLADWNAGGGCFSTLFRPDPVDPMAALDRLGWTGPVAIAETSARSCVSPQRLDAVLPGDTAESPLIFEGAGSPASQAAWVEQTYRAALDRNFLFYAHSFLRDYPPVGPWTVEQGVLPAATQQLVNIWPCSGLQNSSGQPKPEMAAIGLPEPSLGSSFAAAIGLLAALARSRRRC